MEHSGNAFEKDLDTAAETLRAIEKITAQAGVTLCFEPHMQSITNTPEKALALVERVPGLKIALDYAHFVLQYIEIEQIHTLIPHTGYFHLRPARPGKLQTRHAEGTIDFVDISKRLAAANYTGEIAIEYVCAPWFDANQLDTLTETFTTKQALDPYFTG
jgi:sugar phosphate isomerase/epimerase